MSHSMDNRLGFPHKVTPDEYLQCKPRRRTSDASVVIRGMSTGMDLINPLCGKFNEKELMHSLNDRLAGFIEKVHHLEYQNHQLEKEIQETRGRAKSVSCLEEDYGPELRKLRQLVQDITHQKHQIEIEHKNLEDELSDLKGQHEQEVRSRSDAESNIAVLKKDITDAYQAKLQLDKKAQALVDEIHFLKRNHEAEVSEMFDQIQDASLTFRTHEFGNPGVTAALRDIRAQLEGQSRSDFRQVGETLRSQFARLTEAAETKREALKATQQEIQECRRRLQAKNIELDCAKGTREALERQLHDVEDRHREEILHYQNTIKDLENELINCKFDMSGYLREYQDLLNVKMALDVEILSYRKLLCGEEARLSTMSDTHISLPYIYHQSPVYTLPCLSRPGGPHRRAEPQYKFVEEIITETTREIEMSEFEETGSEETEVGKDDQECTKSNGGGSKEEKDNKDDREEDGEQMCHSEQNQVELVGEGDDGGKTQKENEASDNDGDSGTDKNTQSKVLLSEGCDEEETESHQKVFENTKAEKGPAVKMVTDQKDLTSKSDDLKLEVPVEEECLKKSGDGTKGDAETESFILAHAKKPADETLAQVSKESDKTQELSVVQVQDKVHSLVSKTAEKTPDLAAETKSAVFVSIQQLSEGPQTPATSKSEEKEKSHADPKEINKSKATKVDDIVAKSTDSTDSNKGQDEDTSLKSDAKNLLAVKDQKPNSGDRSETIQTELPKEKTTAHAEVPLLNQEVSESSQAQKVMLPDVSEKTSPHHKAP